MSLSVYTNETSSDAHTKLKHKFEFAELLARMMDDCHIQPVLSEEVKVEQIGNFKDLELGKKLWYMMPILAKLLNLKNKVDKEYFEELKNNCNKNGFVK